MVLSRLPLTLLTFCLSAAVGKVEHGDEVYRVKDIDFDNTKIRKDCLLASFNATIEIELNIDGRGWKYVKPFPVKADTKGSYCNMNYQSELQLHYGHNVITMTFARSHIQESVPKKITYCDQCDYGTWHLASIKVDVVVDALYAVQAATPSDFSEHAKWLTNGIDVKRSFKCTQEDNLITIPLAHAKLLNVTSRHEIQPDSLKLDIKFYSIEVQPFLIVTEEFYDPYLCRDVTVSHVLVITLPLIYFFVFIMFYRVKAVYGCPPRRSTKQKSEKLETDIDIEESTNIMSDEYSTIQMGIASSSIPY